MATPMASVVTSTDTSSRGWRADATQHLIAEAAALLPPRPTLMRPYQELFLGSPQAQGWRMLSSRRALRRMIHWWMRS